MIARRLWIVLSVVLFAGSATVRADSLPFVQGAVSGIELCPQSICGAAVFVGAFAGQVGFNPRTVGVISVVVTHEDLPDPGETAAITGGLWQLQLPLRKISGFIKCGTLLNNGDNTFGVSVEMVITNGGVGRLSFEGELSHNAFPPTIKGRISQ